MTEEMIKMAEELVDQKIGLKDLTPSVLKKQRNTTSKREFSELVMRFKTLSSREIEALTTMSIENQRLMCFISCVRSYNFIRDFMEEVVIENVRLLKTTIDDLDYTVFFNRKALEHSDVEKLADTTKKKVKQVVFKMLEQAGLIDNINSRVITIPFITPQLENIVSPEERKYILQK